jgi:hypothetical protein
MASEKPMCRGTIDHILSDLTVHAKIVRVALKLPEVFNEYRTTLPTILAEEIEDLQTVQRQLGRVRDTAQKKGYTELLELLDQELPYRTRV